MTHRSLTRPTASRSRHLLVALAISCLAAPVAAQPELEAINVASPLPGITTSGQISEGDLETIAGAGYVAVINLRSAEENGNWDARPRAEELGLAYHTIPIAGAGEVTPEAAAQLDQLLLELGASPERPVLVHCASSNRVGALFALREAASGADREAALELGRAAGLRSLEGRVEEILAADPD